MERNENKTYKILRCRRRILYTSYYAYIGGYDIMLCVMYLSLYIYVCVRIYEDGSTFLHTETRMEEYYYYSFLCFY